MNKRSLLIWVNRIGPLLALVAVYFLFAAMVENRESFMSLYTLETIARQTTIVGCAAIGMTMIIIAGGIDLSVGSIIALSGVVVAVLLKAGAPPILAALGGIGAGALCGLLNGALITSLRMTPFIVTLGSLLMIRGVTIGLSGKTTVVPRVETWLPKLTGSLKPDDRWQVVPPGVWLMLGLAVLIACMLRYTRFGRHNFAIGSNEATARLCGVHVPWVKIRIYIIGAAFAGLAGVMQFSRLIVGDPTAAQGKELDVIAAVVIGGGSLFGGEGSIFGTMIGALIMTVIAVGCDHMGWENYVQMIVTGGIIIIAVALDRLRHRLES
jgi:ribose/xylose/arabinose/galactoside ABC-type transport system permease subunit